MSISELTLEERAAKFTEYLAEAEKLFGISIHGELTSEKLGDVLQVRINMRLVPIPNWEVAPSPNGKGITVNS